MAFTYRREGIIVSCKYRTVGKRFWRVFFFFLSSPYYISMIKCLLFIFLCKEILFFLFQEKDTEKIFYGLDDIVDSDEIIIVSISFLLFLFHVSPTLNIDFISGIGDYRLKGNWISFRWKKLDFATV